LKDLGKATKKFITFYFKRKIIDCTLQISLKNQAKISGLDTATF